MSEKQYKVPEGMLKAAKSAALARIGCTELNAGGERVNRDMDESFRVAIEAALLWLSENPIVPTDEQWDSLRDWAISRELIPNEGPLARMTTVEWQRRMFLAPEPEVPEEVKDLLHFGVKGFDIESGYNQSILEAYRRGLGNSRTAQKESPSGIR